MSNEDALDAAQQRMSEAAAALAESAAKLRAAIAAGTVPPKATTALATRLEELVARTASDPATPETCLPDVEGRVSE